ncbi:MFS transporter [Streptomyces sp. NBC_00483]|uniref:MFS transporter n=1 Tax=Streptomyces sp. NBC_00483 TaxID=2975756 RepID=UPI002E17E6A2
MNPRIPDPRTARRRYATVCALFWLPVGAAIAPKVLLLTERGFALATITAFVAAHSLTAAALELPTGGLSDVLGRRPVLAAAGVLDLAALALIGLGTTALPVALGSVLLGAGRALSTGPAEAWYVDTVQAKEGPGAELRTGLARGSAASSAALAVGTLIGGGLPWLLGLGPNPGAWLAEATAGYVVPLAVPMLLGVLIELGFIAYVLLALPEPPHPRATLSGVLRGIPATVLDGLRPAGRDATVRRVLLSAGAAGAALFTLELLTPGRAAALTGAPESGAVVFAGLACAGYVCSGVGSHLAPLTARRAGGGERAVLVGLAAGALGLLLLGATAAFTGPAATLLAVAGYGLVYLGLGAAGPNENELLHRRVGREGRATALSVQSLALQLTGAAAGLTIGALPAGPLPWLVGGITLLAGALLWTGSMGGRSQKEPAGPRNEPAGSQKEPAPHPGSAKARAE